MFALWTCTLNFQEDDSVLKTIVAVLSAEEQKHGLKQPTGIGKRPLNNPKESISKFIVVLNVSIFMKVYSS